MIAFKEWLNSNEIAFREVDSEVVEIADFGKIYLADLSGINSIIKDGGFNLPESSEVLIEEGIYHVAFPFGDNFYYYDLREEFRFNLLRYIGRRVATTLEVPFVNLGVHSPYELLNGAGAIVEWVRKAKYLGHSAIGICDYNTMAGTLILQKECRAAGIKHIFGYTLVFEHLDTKVEAKVYALSQKGLQNLLRIQREIMVESQTHTITFDRLLECGEGLALVVGKLGGEWLVQNRYTISTLKERFAKLYFQVDLTEYKAERIDVEILHSVQTFFNNLANHLTHTFEVEPILICDSYYLERRDARSKIILNKIATGAAHKQSVEQYFKDVDEHFAVVESLFSDRWDVPKLFEGMCRATADIAEMATAAYETDRNFMPRYDMTDAEKAKYGDRHAMFIRLLEEGFERLVSADKAEQYRERLNKEIYVLEATDNVDYLLVQFDTVNWARGSDILVGCGRGSAGGSLVLYLLGITLIDPIKYDLLFERFLLPERAGLHPSQTTKLMGDIKSCSYVEVELDNGKVLRLDRDAKVFVERTGQKVVVYADELSPDDEVIFDRRDYLWRINYFDNDVVELAKTKFNENK